MAAQVQEYREKLLDAVVETDEDLMARYLEGEELPAEDVAHALKDAVTRDELYPGRLRRRDEEPRHDRAARPARRGRAVAGEEGHDDRVRRREAGRVRLQDDRRPVRRAASAASASSPGRSPATRRSSIRARTRRSGSASCCCCRARSTSRPTQLVRRRHRRRREAEGRRRPATCSSTTRCPSSRRTSTSPSR